MEERLQKYMARCGVDSRRKCEELIAGGLVEVNGEIVREPGVKIDPMRDSVKVNGKKLRAERPAYYMHYKVKGVTTTVSDDLGRRTVMDCLPDIRERVFPVGRLDKESEGLLVLTNDGPMANYLTHPAHGVEKTYRVVCEGRIERDVLRALSEKGIRLGPVLVKPSQVELVRYDNESTIALISVSEGINREVRRIFAALGHEVKKLLRIQVGPLGLAGMKRGTTRPLTPRELALLKKGMEGMEPAEEEVQFPSGSAKSRKPTGPRGRPRRVKTPRQGKPDPAAARPHAKAGKGKVVEDDWKKRSSNTPTDRAGKGKGRKPGPQKETEKSSKPLRTLRPVKAKGKARPAKQDKAKMPQARKPRPAAHPLTGRRPRKGTDNG